MSFSLLKKATLLLLSVFSISIFSITDSELSQLKALYPNLDVTEYEQKYSKLKDSNISQSDTLFSSDSLDSISSSDSANASNMSLYQMMANNMNINPDSLIQKIEIFGKKTFSRGKSVNAFSTSHTIPSNYTITYGDEIILQIWGRINETQKMVVNNKGMIDLPRIGPISVVGLTFRSLRKNIEGYVKKINGIEADISMGKLNDIKIYVVGEVENPGQYTVPALSGVTNALIAAGGFTDNGSLRSVKLKRGSRTISTFDMYKFLLSGNRFSNRRLLSGDVIYVPVTKKMATIVGNVRRSAIYELKPSMSSLKDLVNLAGGFTPSAWTNRIQIQKFENNDHKTILDIKVDSINNLPDISIADGDIVKVFPILNDNESAIYLAGNVNRPGKYEYKEGLRISDIIKGYDDLKKDTYLKYAVIKRENKNSVSEQLLSFNLLKILQDPTLDDNILLKPKDEITVYNRDFFEPERSVYIGGAVNLPDNYSLMENMTVKDLILKAGGLTMAASETRGELYKRTFDGDSVKTIKIDFKISDALNDKVGDTTFNLSKGNYLFIRSKKAWDDTRTITLLGQFNFPGEYVILENESLLDVINRAGGFRKNAHLEGAVYTRESIKKIEKERNIQYINNLEKEMMTISSQMMAHGTAGSEVLSFVNQQKLMLEKLKELPPIGRLVLDLSDKSDYKNISVDNLDTLYVPKNTGMVSVLGEVFNPSTFILSRGKKTPNSFIQRAGGFKDAANKKKTYVIKANGSVCTKNMANFHRYSLESGDVVVVPKKLPYNTGRFKIFMQTLDAIAKITSITANTAATVGIIKTLQNGTTTTTTTTTP